MHNKELERYMTMKKKKIKKKKNKKFCLSVKRVSTDDIEDSKKDETLDEGYRNWDDIDKNNGYFQKKMLTDVSLTGDRDSLLRQLDNDETSELIHISSIRPPGDGGVRPPGSVRPDNKILTGKTVLQSTLTNTDEGGVIFCAEDRWFDYGLTACEFQASLMHLQLINKNQMKKLIKKFMSITNNKKRYIVICDFQKYLIEWFKIMKNSAVLKKSQLDDKMKPLLHLSSISKLSIRTFFELLDFYHVKCSKSIVDRDLVLTEHDQFQIYNILKKDLPFFETVKQSVTAAVTETQSDSHPPPPANETPDDETVIQLVRSEIRSFLTENYNKEDSNQGNILRNRSSATSVSESDDSRFRKRRSSEPPPPLRPPPGIFLPVKNKDD
eukprot:GHVL01039365.1.p2 GENE.GHVL01039365.1~~GHVL01039365.1.p2  ORF type:complete len:382 (-),score=121.23 GHVL01039365.1:1940-3085(-)